MSTCGEEDFAGDVVFAVAINLEDAEELFGEFRVFGKELEEGRLREGAALASAE